MAHHRACSRRDAHALAIAALLTAACSGSQDSSATSSNGFGGDGASTGSSNSESATSGTVGSAGSSGDPSGSGGSGGSNGSGGAVLADWCATGDSALAKVAQALPPRTWQRMPDSPSLDALDMESSLLYWADSASWDPATRRVRWVGGPGTCCANPAVYQRIEYDVAADEWTMTATPFEGSGHAYDANTIDPGSSFLYFAKFHDEEVRRFDGQSWTSLPALPLDPQAAVGLTWFPELDGGAGGLVYVNGNGEVARFDGNAWTLVEGAEAAPWGTYNVFAEYNPTHGLVWLGGGNEAETTSYLLDGQATLTHLGDAPVSLNVGRTLHMADPVSGNYVVFERELGAWWELDPIADAWTEITDMQSAPDFASSQEWSSVIQVPVPECGVILFLSHYHEYRNVYVYRHGAL